MHIHWKAKFAYPFGMLKLCLRPVFLFKEPSADVYHHNRGAQTLLTRQTSDDSNTSLSTFRGGLTFTNVQPKVGSSLHLSASPLRFFFLIAAVEPVAPSPTPGPGPAAPGPDLDGDGNLDRWEYVGCFENPPTSVADFDTTIDGDDTIELTPIVSARRLSFPLVRFNCSSRNRLTPKPNANYGYLMTQDFARTADIGIRHIANSSLRDFRHVPPHIPPAPSPLRSASRSAVPRMPCTS